MIFLKYDRQNCVHCGREFAKNDDIVVCPVCGTPHHRECWAEGNGCGNAFRHDEGYVYKNPNEAQQSDKTEKCPVCGNENPDSSLVCHKCGADLTKGAGPKTQPGSNPFVTFDFGKIKDPYMESDEKIDDVPVSEIAKQVGVKNDYYIPTFKRMSKRKLPISWNWAACLMPTCVWFYYRRCYLAGTFAAIFDIIVQVLFNGFLTGVTELATMGYSDMQAVTALESLMFSPTGLAFFGITIGFRILMGLSGNAFYRAQVMNNIRFNRENEKQRPGGTNIIAPVLGYFIFSNIAMIITSIIS